MYVYSVIQSKWPHHPDPRMSKGKKRKKRKKERKKVEPNSSITKAPFVSTEIDFRKSISGKSRVWLRCKIRSN